MTPQTTVVSGASDVDDLRAALAATEWIAVDTEFHAERVYTPVLMLAQVYVPGGRAWILDPLLPGNLLKSLAADLLRPGWILHAGQWDLRILYEMLEGAPERVRDTQVAAGLVGPRYPHGLAAVAREWLGQDLDKGEALSDWSRRPLTPSQLAYAARDVTVLPGLWDRLYEAATARGIAAIVDAASAEAAALALAPPNDDDAWLDLGAAEQLEPRDAAGVRAVAAWRERHARHVDQPPRVVLSDGVVVAMGRGSWEQGRLGRPIDKALAREANAAARAAREAPDATWPATLRPGTEARARHALWCAVAERTALERGVAARLLWPDIVLRTLALADDVGAIDLDALLGWRAPWLQQTVRDVASGRLGIGLHGAPGSIGRPA